MKLNTHKARVALLVLTALIWLFAFGQVVLAADPAVTIVVTAMRAPDVISFPATDITAISAKLNGMVTDTGGADIVIRGFEWGLSTGNYTASWNETGIFGVGAFSHTAGNLTLGVEVFWRAFAANDHSVAYSVERSFFPTMLPNPPTNFVATQTGVNQVTLSWTMGVGAVNTTIRVAEGSPPTSLTGGYEVYTGGGTSVNVTMTIDELSSYGFSAWSVNSYGYSLSYATATIGGDMTAVMTFLFLSLLPLGLMIGMFVTKQFMLGFPSGMFWAILGAYAYTQSTHAWSDWQYVFFFACMGMAIFSFIAMYGLRKRDLAGPDADKGAFIDEGGRKRPRTGGGNVVVEMPRPKKSWGDIDDLPMYATEDAGYESPPTEHLHEKIAHRNSARKTRAEIRRYAKHLGI